MRQQGAQAVVACLESLIKCQATSLSRLSISCCQAWQQVYIFEVAFQWLSSHECRIDANGYENLQTPVHLHHEEDPLLCFSKSLAL